MLCRGQQLGNNLRMRVFTQPGYPMLSTCVSTSNTLNPMLSTCVSANGLKLTMSLFSAEQCLLAVLGTVFRLQPDSACLRCDHSLSRAAGCAYT